MCPLSSTGSLRAKPAQALCARIIKYSQLSTLFPGNASWSLGIPGCCWLLSSLSSGVSWLLPSSMMCDLPPPEVYCVLRYSPPLDCSNLPLGCHCWILLWMDPVIVYWTLLQGLNCTIVDTLLVFVVYCILLQFNLSVGSPPPCVAVTSFLFLGHGVCIGVVHCLLSCSGIVLARFPPVWWSKYAGAPHTTGFPTCHVTIEPWHLLHNPASMGYW